MHSKPTKFMFTPEDLFWEKALASYITVKLCCSTSVVFDIIVDQLLIKFNLSLANERKQGEHRYLCFVTTATCLENTSIPQCHLQ